jgi:hypothetical protein
MEIMGFIFGLAGLSFGILAYLRIGALEKKFKETGALDQNFNSQEQI